jgi:hypothetical protein
MAKSDATQPGTTAAGPAVLLVHHLKQLKLPTVLREYEKVARECARDGVDHVRFLLRLVELELLDRERRVTERRIREAKFPAVKSLDTFDFTAIPSLNKMLVLELARCQHIERRENIIAVGNSGTGKTQVSIGAPGPVPRGRRRSCALRRCDRGSGPVLGTAGTRPRCRREPSRFGLRRP